MIGTYDLSRKSEWIYIYISDWWFQPIWKICSSNWMIFPNFRGENKKYLKPSPRSPIQKFLRWLLDPGSMTGEISFSQKIPGLNFVSLPIRLRRIQIYNKFAWKKWIPPSPLELDPLIPGNPFHVTKFWLPKPNPKKKKKKNRNAIHRNPDFTFPATEAPAGCCAPHPEAPHKLLASVPRHVGQSSSPAILWKFRNLGSSPSSRSCFLGSVIIWI